MNGHDIRHGKAQQEEKEHQHGERVGEAHRGEAARRRSRAGNDHHFRPETAHEAVSEEPSQQFRQRECREPQPGGSEGHAFILGEEHAAPVHDGPFREEADARHDAEEDDRALRHGAALLAAVRAVGEEVPGEHGEQDENDPHMHGGDPRVGEPRGLREKREESRPDEAAHAVKGVHAAHDVLLRHLFHDDAVQIDGHVERSHAAAEDEERRDVHPERRQVGNDEQVCRGDERRGAEERAACEMAGENAREGHEKAGARADAEQQQPQHVRLDGKALLQRRDEHDPCGERESAHEKSALRCGDLPCPRGESAQKCVCLCHRISFQISGWSSFCFGTIINCIAGIQSRRRT